MGSICLLSDGGLTSLSGVARPFVRSFLPRHVDANMASGCRHCSLLVLALLALSAGQGVAPLLKAIEGNNPSQLNMALKSTHPKLLKERPG